MAAKQGKQGSEGKYSTPVAFIFIFNVILGTGVLTLPSASVQAGAILTVILLLIMGFLAYITVTFLLEALAIANAFISRDEEAPCSVCSSVSDSTSTSDSNSTSEGDCIDIFGSSTSTEECVELPTSTTDKDLRLSIDRRVELGKLAEMFLGPIGMYIFYFAIILYLFGNLALYATSVPQSLQRIFGSWNGSLSCEDSYYVYLTFFMLTVVPFCFFNFQKTKWLQFATMGLRNVSLIAIIVLAAIKIARSDKPATGVVLANFESFPAFFGVTILSFMCHHSLPGIVAPIKNKKKLKQVIGIDFIMIFVVYVVLCITGLYAFGDQILPIYTFNFSDQWKPLAIFLQLFPVFTLSSSFPILAITLRNNIITLVKALLGPKRLVDHPVFRVGRERYAEILFSIVAVFPPLAIAFVTNNVTVLVKVTGSYPGLGIMFIAPTIMIYFARRKLKNELGCSDPKKNPMASPFQSLFWNVLILAWCFAAVVLVTYNMATSTASYANVCGTGSTNPSD